MKNFMINFLKKDNIVYKLHLKRDLGNKQKKNIE